MDNCRTTPFIYGAKSIKEKPMRSRVHVKENFSMSENVHGLHADRVNMPTEFY